MCGVLVNIFLVNFHETLVSTNFLSTIAIVIKIASQTNFMLVITVIVEVFILMYVQHLINTLYLDVPRTQIQ